MLKRTLWRLGRRLYCFARDDVPNVPERNGEYWLLERIARARQDEKLVVMDVGANVGDYSSKLGVLAAQHRNELFLHVFEPTPSTHEVLKSRLTRHVSDRVSITFNRLAASSKSGPGKLYVVEDCGGTNTVLATAAREVVEIDTITLAEYCERQGLARVDLIKCDTEGFDCEVILGAMPLLKDGRVGVLQFEYNQRWIGARRFLRDVFELVEGTRYRVGKLSRNKLVIYPEWHYELEKYFEGNYVLLRDDWSERIRPHVGCFDASNTFS